MRIARICLLSSRKFLRRHSPWTESVLMNLSTLAPEANPEAALVNQVASRLQTCGHPSLRHLHVTIARDAIILQGTLPSFYLKQMAQVLAKSVEGVSCVENHTVVHRVSA